MINYEYKVKKSGSNVEVDGRYDINIWYLYNNNIKIEVWMEIVLYKDNIKLCYKDEDLIGDDYEVIVCVL